MIEYCERCNRCHDDGLRNDEECCYYGEPNGCNHPDYGFEELPDNPASVADMLDREVVKLNDALELKNAQVVSLLARIKELESHQCEYALPDRGCTVADKNVVELQKRLSAKDAEKIIRVHYAGKKRINPRTISIAKM